MRYTHIILTGLLLLAACTSTATSPAASTEPPPTETTVAPTEPPPTETFTPEPTETPAQEWGIAFAVVDPQDVEHGPERTMTLHIIHPDGSGLRSISKKIESINGLTASPDGHELLFSAVLEDTDENGYVEHLDLPHLYRMNVKSSEIFTLTNGNTTMEWASAWSPDGQQIAFASAEVDAPNYRYVTEFRTFLYIVNRDGTEKIQIIQQEGDIRSLAWSPTGEHIAFLQNDALWVVHPDGSNLSKVADSIMIYRGYSNIAQPTWSPDGNWITFINSGTGEKGYPDIYIIRPDGSGLSNITDHPAADFQPVWSPDGAQIAFITDREEKWTTYVTSVNNKDNIQAISHGPVGSAINPVWSPDGARIAFTAGKDEAVKDSLFIENVSNSQVYQLDNLLIGDRPAWVVLPQN